MNGQRRSGICTEWNISHEKNKAMPFEAPQMDLEGIMLSEINQTEKDKYCIVSLIWGI